MLFFAERFIIFSLVQNTKNAGLVQLVEHRTRNAGVTGSSPASGINNKITDIPELFIPLKFKTKK